MDCIVIRDINDNRVAVPLEEIEKAVQDNLFLLFGRTAAQMREMIERDNHERAMSGVDEEMH